MHPLSRQTVAELAAHDEQPAVSLFMPLRRHSRSEYENATTLRNLTKLASQQLRDRGEVDAAEDILGAVERSEALEAILSTHTARGLALFIAPGVTRQFALPSFVRELVVVGGAFHVKPLVPLLENSNYYVLALSKNSVRLFHSTRTALTEVNLPHGTPQGMSEALAGTEVQKSTQHHAAPVARGAGTDFGSVHGQGHPKDDAKNLLEAYLRQVASPLNQFLNQTPEPLVLVAVERLQSMFRRVCRHPRILAEGISLSPDRMDLDELLGQANAAFESCTQRESSAAAERFRQLVASGRVSTDLENVLSRASNARVETLFVAEDVEKWAPEECNAVDVHRHQCEQRAGCVDLLNTAAVHTLRHDGTVHAVPLREVPRIGKGRESAIAAILRW